MGSPRFIKTPKLAIVLQVSETTAPGMDGRAWEVHDIERNRGFRVTLVGRSQTETPPGRSPIGRPFSQDEVDAAMGLAIERALATPPEKVGGTLYDVPVSSEDLYDSLAPR